MKHQGWLDIVLSCGRIALVSRIKKLVSTIARIAQFRVNWGGKLFFEHLVASLILCIASAGFIIFIPGQLFFFVGGAISFSIEKLLGRNASNLFLAALLIIIGVFVVAIPLLLLSRLVLVFKKDGVLGFLGALVGELFIVIPFTWLLLFLFKMVGSLVSGGVGF